MQDGYFDFTKCDISKKGTNLSKKDDQEYKMDEEHYKKILNDTEKDVIMEQILDDVFKYSSMYRGDYTSKKPKTRKMEQTWRLLDEYRQMLTSPEDKNRVNLDFLIDIVFKCVVSLNETNIGH